MGVHGQEAAPWVLTPFRGKGSEGTKETIMTTLYPIKRTPEEGHTKACLAKAMTTVIENWKDDTSVSDFDFQVHIQANGVLEEVYTYLKEGLTVCLCDPISKTDLFGPNGQLSHFGRD